MQARHRLEPDEAQIDPFPLPHVVLRELDVLNDGVAVLDVLEVY